MMNFILVSILFFTVINAEFNSYDGSNCAFVYDAVLESSYPLNVCITDYDKTNANPYLSREYICSRNGDGSADIEVYTYYGNNCSGAANAHESRSALGSTNPAYKCGDGVSAEYDQCYLEYKEYATGNDGCSGWIEANYNTKYIIVGSCLSVDGFNQYAQCNTATNNYDVQYVRFNEETCCGLSYVFTSHDGPAWKDYSHIQNVQIGCTLKMYIDADSWTCYMPDGANDESVFTDNQNEECGDANVLVVNLIIYIIFASLMFLY
eukprot:UN01743